ncbi:sensor histidine kinase [Streptomyces sp. NPDC048665]|uniref:sensor histidine kinase n=1 Tax=Streptomyces sp. NPDC048665 TaxID=3155490 RepID=UPI003415BE6E
MVTVISERFPRPARTDVLLAAVFAAVVAVGSVPAASGQTGRRLDVPGGLFLVAAAVAATAFRRVAPLGALVATTLLVNAYLLVGYPYGPVLLCLVIAVFEVARQRPLPVSATACGAASALSSATILVREFGELRAVALLALAWSSWSVLPWSLGALIHVMDAARRRARQDLIARTALEERMRIAGEVHDIAGHGFALITMQAQVALLVFEEQPEQARRSLVAVCDTSSTALADLRKMLDAVHPHSGRTVAARSAAVTERPADPAGVVGLNDLIQNVRAGGVPVEVEVESELESETTGDGFGERLPEPVSAALFRVVQEALTNVLRHAGPTTARVTIGRHYGEVLVRVADRGRGRPDTVGPPGRGLAGMRRRVEELDGRLEAGPREGGGFQVEARLPVPEETA